MRAKRFVLGAVVFLLGIYLTPTVYSLFLSLDLFAVPPVSGAPSFRWYIAVFSDQRLRGALSRSVGVASLVSLVTVVICTLAFSSFHRCGSRLKRIMIGTAVLPLFVPETTHALTLSDALSRLGLTTGWWCVAIGEAVYVTPFVSIVVILRIASLSPNLDNASADLGMNSLRRLIYVTIPLVWATGLSAFVLGFLLSFNEYARAAYFEAREMYAVYLRGNLNGGGSQSVYAVSSAMFLLGGGVLWLLAALSKKASAGE